MSLEKKKKTNSIKIRTTTINVVKERKNGPKLLSKDSVRPLKSRSGNSVTDDVDRLLTL